MIESTGKRAAARVLGAVCLAVGLGLTAACGGGAGPEDAAAPTEAEIEALRALPYISVGEAGEHAAGVSIMRDGAWPGYNLLTDDQSVAFAIDMEGEVVHEWRLPEPYRRCEHLELLDDGGILAVCVHQALVRLDRDSELVWSVDERVHHDVALLEDGSYLVPVREEPVEYNGYRVRFDSLLRVDASGTIREVVWSTRERLEELRAHHPPLPLDTGTLEDRSTSYDYYHLNTVEVLPANDLGESDPRFRAGNLLICLRNANLVVILDRESLDVVWSWGPGELSYPHAPEMLADGRILIFDNGVSRDYSRVVEVDPAAGEIEWEYTGSPPQSFYSRWRGSAQRLPGGTTLICEADSGRLFEVTREGELIWEYWTPVVETGKRRRVYRVRRVPASRLGRVLRGAEVGGR